MNIFTVSGIGICAAVAALLLRELGGGKGSFGIPAAVGIIILGLIAVGIGESAAFFGELIKSGGLSEDVFVPIRALGIAYSAAIAAELCRDAGEGSIGDKIEFAARIEILVISLPLARRLFEFGINMI